MYVWYVTNVMTAKCVFIKIEGLSLFIKCLLAILLLAYIHLYVFNFAFKRAKISCYYVMSHTEGNVGDLLKYTRIYICINHLRDELCRFRHVRLPVRLYIRERIPQF